MKRRTLLAIAGLAGLAACDIPGSFGGGQTSGGNAGTLSFTNRLHIPPLAEPVVESDGLRRFDLRVQAGQTEFRAGQPAATLGVNGPYLGPTIRAARGDRVRMDVHNGIGETTTMHWHGMRLPAAMDGGPHQLIEPGATWSPTWTVDQPAATSWYHPHPHGATARQIYRGVAGLFLLDDENSAGLELPRSYGVDDIPLILQDKKFTEAGELSEDAPGWGATFGILGEHIAVNGTIDPFVDVRTTLVRLRILNASNARMFHLRFADGRAMQVVGTDAGMLAEPVRTDGVRLSPGERVEVVVEFSDGEGAVLTSSPGDQVIDGAAFDIVRFVAADRLERSPALPQSLGGRPLIEPAAGARVRRFTLSGSARINSKEFDMGRIDEVVPARAREIWEVENIVFAHNFHIHEVAFRVLDVDGSPPPQHEQGPKDTVFVPANTTVRLAVEFGQYTDPTTPYMYHCHILFHEDTGMMGQFVVVEPGTEGSVATALPVGHHNHGG